MTDDGTRRFDDVATAMRQYATLLRGIWALTAVLVVTLPVLNTALRVISPHPQLEVPMAALATVAALLVVLYIYIDRRELWQGSRPPAYRGDAPPNRLSAHAIVFAAVAFLTYYAHSLLMGADHVVSVNLIAAGLDPSRGLLVHVLRPAIVLTYSIFFVSVAAAFNLLLMKVYMDEWQRAADFLGQVPRPAVPAALEVK